MTAILVLDENVLQQICAILGDTGFGLTGSEISRLLQQADIDDIEPSITKRHRLFVALDTRQKKDGCANNIFAFIKKAMDPVRYTDNIPSFEERRGRLNTVLALRGYSLGEDGELRMIERARTLTEAEARASELKEELIRRRIHSEVLKYCKAELLQNNYFHAVFEATKSIAERIREMSGLTNDTSSLVDEALNVKNPFIAISALRTETELSEQKGFINFLKGIFGMFRNPTAHEPKIKWPILKDEATDLLSVVSFVHRKLDSAVVVKTTEDRN